jgi:excisionase family DNA binding protein
LESLEWSEKLAGINNQQAQSSIFMKTQDSGSLSGTAAGQKLLTAQEVAALLRLPLSTVYHLAKIGDLPAVQFGRTWRFPSREIAALTESKPAKARILVVDDDEARQPIGCAERITNAAEPTITTRQKTPTG